MTTEISSRIRKAYQDSSGDWCYEKGKSKEIKFLKEACEHLDWQKRMKNSYYQKYKEALAKANKLHEKLEEYEDSK